jgi:F-box-like
MHRSFSATHPFYRRADLDSDYKDESFSIVSLEESKSLSYPFPFHRLPLELLVAIFQEFERSSRRYNRGRVPAPVILSHVCHLWRNVALDAAALWTDIRIYDFNWVRTRLYSEAFFERSKSGLVDVNYRFCEPTSSLVIALSCLLQHIERVRRLTVIAEDNLSVQTVMKIINDAVTPRLESLRISLLDISMRSSSDPGILVRETHPLFINSAPLLQSVQLNGIPRMACPQSVVITSFTLRMHVKHRRVHLPHFIDFLSNTAATLIRLRLWEVELYSEPDDHPVQPVELPLLESLDLSQARILYYLDTPRLKRLYMKDVDDETLETFIRRSSSWELSTLQSLKLDDLNLWCFKDQTAVVCGLPLLNDLMIWDCAHQDTFLILLKQGYAGDKCKRKATRGMGHHDQNYQQASINSLINSAHPGIIMPNLRSLTISSEDSWPLIQTIIQSRIKKGIPFDCVRFPKEVCIDNGLKEISSWLMERGVNCEFFAYYTEEIAELGDSEWIADEEYFNRDAPKRDLDSNEDHGDETSDLDDSDDYSEDLDE